MGNSVIEINGLTKKFGTVTAVDNLSMVALPGRVTGFLGPNGSGKTTTLRMLLGLIKPDSGTATIDGQRYEELEKPAFRVGSALEAAFHPAHSGRVHLEIYALAVGVPKFRVAETLNLVGLSDAADRKTAGYSLGMRQRLALATALITNPDVILLDEPINGLDPEGIRWIRDFLRHLANSGKTVLLSSHMLSEVQQSVDDVIVINDGRLAYSGTLDSLRQIAPEKTILVDSRERIRLAEALSKRGARVAGLHSVGPLNVTGLESGLVGEISLQEGIALTHLTVQEEDLETSFLALIEGDAK